VKPLLNLMLEDVYTPRKEYSPATLGKTPFLDGSQYTKKQPDHKVIGLRPRFFRGLLWSWIIQREPLQEAETIYTKNVTSSPEHKSSQRIMFLWCPPLGRSRHLDLFQPFGWLGYNWAFGGSKISGIGLASTRLCTCGCNKKGQTVYFYADHFCHRSASLLWRFVPRILGPSGLTKALTKSVFGVKKSLMRRR